MEFYLTKSANWVRALYPRDAPRFPPIQSDRLQHFALEQFRRRREKRKEREAGRGEVGWGSGRTTVVKATANRYFILSQSLKSASRR